MSDESDISALAKVKWYMGEGPLDETTGYGIDLTNRSFLSKVANVTCEGTEMVVEFVPELNKMENKDHHYTVNSEAHGGVRQFIQAMLARAPIKPRVSYDDAMDLFESEIDGNTPVTVSVNFNHAVDAEWVQETFEALVMRNGFTTPTHKDRPSKAGHKH